MNFYVNHGATEDEVVAARLSHEATKLHSLARKMIEDADVPGHDMKLAVLRGRIGALPTDLNGQRDFGPLRLILQSFANEMNGLIEVGEAKEAERKRRVEVNFINARLEPTHRALFLKVQGSVEHSDERLATDFIACLPTGVDLKLGMRGEIVITGLLPPAHAAAIERLGPAIVAELRRREPPVTIHKVAAGAAR